MGFRSRTGVITAVLCMLWWGGAAAQGAQPVSGQGAQGDSLRRAAVSQSRPRVEARFVPDSVGIGDVLTLEVEVSKDIMQVVDFPHFENNMLGDKLEIVTESPVDTLERDGRRVRLARRYTLQAFDEGWFGFGRFPLLYADKNIIDTVWSPDTLRLKVGTFDIDPQNQTIYDIKPPAGMPLRFGEISGYILYGLLALAAVAALVWYVYTRRRNLSLTGKPRPVDPPHVVAVRRLEELHNQKLWQNNRHKAYYSGITDILREYLEGRYGIRAMEMTSDEIAAALRERGLPGKSYETLAGMLSVSDLVKFAKFAPEGDANEEYYNDAYYFVEQTKPLEVETPAEEGADL